MYRELAASYRRLPPTNLPSPETLDLQRREVSIRIGVHRRLMVSRGLLQEGQGKGGGRFCVAGNDLDVGDVVSFGKQKGVSYVHLGLDVRDLQEDLEVPPIIPSEPPLPSLQLFDLHQPLPDLVTISSQSAVPLSENDSSAGIGVKGDDGHHAIGNFLDLEQESVPDPRRISIGREDADQNTVAYLLLRDATFSSTRLT